MTTVAAIDCGTNSIRLLIAQQDGNTLVDLHRDMRIVRLGEGVDQTGSFAPAALERTLAAVSDFSAVCRQYDADRIRFVATSATRDASNRDTFVSGVRSLLGINPEVISGEEEAALSFAGALRVFGAPRTSPGDTLVVDLGGGSTELVTGATSPVASFSMDIGCVRMTERHLFEPEVSAEAVHAARQDIRAALDEAERHVPLAEVTSIVGVAGTITTVTAHVLKLASYQPGLLNGARTGIDETIEACKSLLSMSRSDRGALGFMHPGRIDVIGAGALIWSEVLHRIQQRTAHAGELELVTSEYDILDGTALSLSN